jgi:hypothetical protein
MKNKILLIIGGIFYVPVALVWGLIWGVLGGIIGMVLGTFQDWQKVLKGEHSQWKYLPKQSVLDWKLLENEDDPKKKPSLKRLERLEEIEENKKHTPYPIFQYIVFTVYYWLLILPFRLVWGLIMGPVYCCIDNYNFFIEKILKKEREITVEDIVDEFERI